MWPEFKKFHNILDVEIIHYFITIRIKVIWHGCFISTPSFNQNLVTKESLWCREIHLCDLVILSNIFGTIAFLLISCLFHYIFMVSNISGKKRVIFIHDCVDSLKKLDVNMLTKARRHQSTYLKLHEGAEYYHLQEPRGPN